MPHAHRMPVTAWDWWRWSLACTDKVVSIFSDDLTLILRKNASHCEEVRLDLDRWMTVSQASRTACWSVGPWSGLFAHEKPWAVQLYKLLWCSEVWRVDFIAAEILPEPKYNELSYWSSLHEPSHLGIQLRAMDPEWGNKFNRIFCSAIGRQLLSALVFVDQNTFTV